MTYRITLVLAGGYSLSCLADEAIRDGCVEAHDERAAPSPAPDEGDGPAPGEALPLAWPPGKRRACPSPDAIRAQAIGEVRAAVAAPFDYGGRGPAGNADRETTRVTQDAIIDRIDNLPTSLPPGTRVVVIPADAEMRIARVIRDMADLTSDAEGFLEEAREVLRALTEGEKP